MHIDWQSLTVGLIVALALAYLARSGWRAIARRRAGCGACSTCPGSKTEPAVNVGAPAIVSLEPLKPKSRG